VRRAPAAAKINLALLVGPRREDGLHEIVTVLQRIDLCDVVTLEPAPALAVEGYRGDSIVRTALAKLAAARVHSDADAFWRVRLEKRIPVAAGLGGGSADAGTALALANRTLADPLPADGLAELAAEVGADVPFFLTPGPKLAEGAGERLRPLELPQDYWVLIALPRVARKRSTGDVYRRFDESGGGEGFEDKRAALVEALASVRRPRDFASFPPNDLAAAGGSSTLVEALLAGGAFRADVSGAGPAVYALYHHRAHAERAARRLRARARVWVVAPVW
jgi:4-diphosphocytidyl-2-C-methyl-D-erythritol kinase